MSEIAKLIERLRSGLDDLSPDEAMTLAADALARLTAERDALRAQVATLRDALDQIRGMADEGIDAPNAAYRWCERIEEVCCRGAAMEEYAQWGWTARAALRATEPKDG